MHFVLQTPSLHHLALIKIAAGLWNHPDILKLIAEPYAEPSGSFEEDFNKWKVVKDTVGANALALELAEPYKRQLLKFIVLMETEIVAWCRCHYMVINENDEIEYLQCTLPKRFCWTMHGTVDYAQTAQLMVKDERLSIERRYEMACINCLEDEARQLFPLVAEDRRREYMTRVIEGSSLDQHDYNIVFLTCILRGDADQLNVCFQQVVSHGVAINLYLFFRSLFSGHRTACDYFFNKLNRAEKEFALGRKANDAFNACADTPPFNLLLYFLSLMSEEQKERLFGESMGDVLVCLLNWPMQSLFMEAAEGGKRYMACSDYEKVLCAIARKISDGAQDYDYSQLFRECWFLTPADVQRRLLDNVGFLDKLVDTDQEEIVYLFWKEAPAHQLLALIKRNDKLRRALRDESVMSALMKYKEKATLVSSNDQQEKQKRLRSQLVDIAMEDRIKRRRL